MQPVCHSIKWAYRQYSYRSEGEPLMTMSQPRLWNRSARTCLGLLLSLLLAGAALRPAVADDTKDSKDVKNGDWCVCVGHPGGYKEGRTPVVRVGRVLAHNDNHLQSDCTMVGGDSGGPLFDLDGKVIGINSRIGLTIASNIHVPVDT